MQRRVGIQKEAKQKEAMGDCEAKKQDTRGSPPGNVSKTKQHNSGKRELAGTGVERRIPKAHWKMCINDQKTTKTLTTNCSDVRGSCS
jgi:hypothetical protein